MKNIFKKLIIVTSFALISSTGLHAVLASPDLTFDAAKTAATDQKTAMTAAITAISNANVVDGVLEETKENEETKYNLTNAYQNIFTTHIQNQEDATVKEILTVLYVAKIAGAAVSRGTTALLSDTDFLNKEEANVKTTLSTKVNEILTAIGYTDNKYKEITVKKDALQIDTMLGTPLPILAQVQKLITSLIEAKTEINKKSIKINDREIKFSSMLGATFGGKTIKDHLNAAAENIEKLSEDYFKNIKATLITRSESLAEASQQKVTPDKLDTKKEGLAEKFYELFNDEGKTTEE